MEMSPLQCSGSATVWCIDIDPEPRIRTSDSGSDSDPDPSPDSDPTHFFSGQQEEKNYVFVF
jgi:hypothetical protein